MRKRVKRKSPLQKTDKSYSENIHLFINEKDCLDGWYFIDEVCMFNGPYATHAEALSELKTM